MMPGMSAQGVGGGLRPNSLPPPPAGGPPAPAPGGGAQQIARDSPQEDAITAAFSNLSFKPGGILRFQRGVKDSFWHAMESQLIKHAPWATDKTKRPCVQHHCMGSGCSPSARTGLQTCGRCHDALTGADETVFKAALATAKAALPPGMQAMLK